MTTDPDASWRRLVINDSLRSQLGALWGKSAEKGGGTTNLLLQHLFDAMAVGELVWDDYLAPAFKSHLDEAATGQGRRLYVWLCGMHDIGKATPAFQRLKPDLAERVRATGLSWPPLWNHSKRWRHDRAGALTLLEILKEAWPGGQEQIRWLWPMVAGHHGTFPSMSVFGTVKAPSSRRALQGDPSWLPIQRLIVHLVTAAAGWDDLGSAQPARSPAKADQLALSGLISMADWIASNEHHFAGIDRLQAVSLQAAMERAANAWSALSLGRGWRSMAAPSEETFLHRFRSTPRPTQQIVMDVARNLPAPGLLVVEAPMGEGKTEAALAAAEILASRFGSDGVYVAMPTQATSDAMYERVRSWLGTFDERSAVALLHGRRRVSNLTRGRSAFVDQGASEGPDSYGTVDDPPSVYGSICEDVSLGEEEKLGEPAEWFFGRYRGLLAANGVGTIDQALYAATRTKFVALRYAGLAGKVVIFDEVHAADAYMAQFLEELLWWLGNGRVPVILLSATLAPTQRERLVGAYLEGATVRSRTPPARVPPQVGYPNVLAAAVSDRTVHYDQRSVASWRPSEYLSVSVLEEQPSDGPEAVVAVLRERLVAGGCALLIRNTVGRAQETFRWARNEFGKDAVLLHSRFASGERARITERLLAQLGPGTENRPHRLVVVATQVAEQSFDIDADILVTDLAPLDLVLQRAGRVHRHQRPKEARPEAVRQPHVIVTGFRLTDGVPRFPRGSEAVYGRHLLLRSAALVIEAMAGRGWSVPADVPKLVAHGYSRDPIGPESWRGEAERAQEEWAGKIVKREGEASNFLLAPSGQAFAVTLEGLHTWGGADGERHVQVRDGDMGEEVILVVESKGEWHTFVGGVRLGPNGDSARDRIGEVLDDTLRLPGHDPNLNAAAARLSPLPGWRDDPWLGKARALRLDRDGQAEIGGHKLTYDRVLGLTIEWAQG